MFLESQASPSFPGAGLLVREEQARRMQSRVIHYALVTLLLPVRCLLLGTIINLKGYTRK